MKGTQRWMQLIAVAWLLWIVQGECVAQLVRVATAPGAGDYATIVAESRGLIDSIMRARNIPGLSIAVSVDGEFVWSEGFGYANLEQRTPVRTTTKFRIGSISKPVTAAALGLLYEQGSVDLDAHVQQYVPSFPEKDKGVVTTRLLAGHLAGVRHYNGLEFLSSRRYASVTEGLAIFQDDTLLTPPGERYSYSSYGWNLISAVIEGASGEEFLTYVREKVFRPIGMTHTVADYTDSIILGRTGFYERTGDGALINAPYVDNSYKWAGGGFLSTPEDLLRFANAHLREHFLKPETLDVWWTSQRNTAGEEVGYGIGWSVEDISGNRVISHGGGSVGGSCWLGIVPDAGVVIAITTNVSDGGFQPVLGSILLKFVGAHAG